MNRRQFVSALGAATVLGFNPIGRRWVSAAQACPSPFEHLPPLDGEVVTDASSLAADATDAGNLVEHTPAAILRPGSVTDICKMVRYCRRLRIKVAARGQHHTTFGQGLVEGGLIIETRALDTIYSVGDRIADVGAGVLWKDLVQLLVPNGRTPPVLTGFTGLTIGGTLSVGGISSSSRYGAQVDHVLELEVVTGEGEVVICSRDRHRGLFEGVLAGLGQLAIITRARIELIPVKPMVRNYLLYYGDNATFFADLRTLLNRGEFNDVFNIWVPNTAGGFLCQLNAVVQFDPSQPPDDTQLLRGLNFDPATRQVQDMSSLDYLLRGDTLIDLADSMGLWKDVIHPWFDVFLSDREIERYMGEVVPELTPADIGATGLMLLFPQRRSRFTRTMLQLPRGEDEWFYLFDILTSNSRPGPDPDFAAKMVARNRRLYLKARRAGGSLYPIGAVPMSKADWIAQYGLDFGRLVGLKLRHDPDNILTPGPGIF